MGWKYVMLEGQLGDLKILFPIIFPDKLVHSDVVRRLRVVTPGWRSNGVAVVSAGKIEHVAVDGLGGGSETLSLQSKLHDAEVIENYSYLHGIVE
jgi:hypothetical protein